MPPKTKTKTDKITRRKNSESSSNEVEEPQKSTPLSKSKHSSDELSEEEPVLNVGKGSPALVEEQPPPDGIEPPLKNLSPHSMDLRRRRLDVDASKEIKPNIQKRRPYVDRSKEMMYGKMENDSTDCKDSPLYKYIAMLAFIVLFAFAFLYIEFDRESDETSTGNRSLIEVRSEMISLAKVLRQTTNQNKDFWIDMLVGLDNLAEEEPRQASILMFAVPKDAENTALCLSQLLAGYVRKSFRDRGPKVVHDTRKFLSLSPSDHKLALDNELHGLNSSHSAIIYNLELMPAETATLLHGYCDNDNAPFKRAIIFLLVEIGSPYEDVSLGRLDSFMESFFFKMYGPQLDADHIPGLVSRLTPQVVLVKPESQEVMNRVCV